MTLEQALAFFVFSVVAAGTPGPSNALLTATGANVGVWRGLPALFGVGVGMGLMMFVVAFGLGSVILDNPLILTGVKWCGAAVLLWLAWKIATAHGASPATGGKPIGFFGAAAFQWVNPKTFLDHRAGSALIQSLAFALTFVVAALPSILPWLAFGAVLQRWLRSERARRIFNLAMGGLLAASVILIIH